MPEDLTMRPPSNDIVADKLPVTVTEVDTTNQATTTIPSAIDDVTEIGADEGCSFIQRHENKMVHICKTNEEGTISSLWKTNCGWRYAGASAFKVPSLPNIGLPCKKCFKNSCILPKEEATRKDKNRSELDEGSSSSSSESSSDSSTGDE